VTTALALGYPNKPVRVIDPFGAGGGPDVIARAVAPHLSDLWGQSVIVENHPGAGSTAAPALVAQALPDGYTLLINTSAHAYSAALLTNLPYDPLNDFIPVAPLTSQPYVFVVGNQARITTIEELIERATVRPGELTFGSTGMGTGSHLGVEKFNLQARISAEHVPARPGDAITDAIDATVEGQTTYAMWPISLALPQIREGRLVALAVSGTRRSRQLPQVPTVAEAGVPGYDFPIWYGIWAPSATPPGIVSKLAHDIATVLARSDTSHTLASHDSAPMQMTQKEFALFVLSESEQAARIISAAGIKHR
jgi:tripartite-type tricarboxylate transporter receptor subunit TctC